MKELIRTVILRPYRKDLTKQHPARYPVFTVKVYDTGKTVPNGPQQALLSDLLSSEFPGKPIFKDFSTGCSPLVAIDSDESIASIISGMCMRPGDTDRDWFDNYTPEQWEFVRMHAESLGYEAYCRFDPEAKENN